MTITGTKEWAASNVNVCDGCSHDCLYCYAKSMAIRFKRKTRDNWHVEDIREKAVTKSYGKMRGTVMFPSSHDITPTNFDACFVVLRKLLEAGNRVLVVSKPHLECIKKLCSAFGRYRDNILFRFTIGACDDDILSYWEPHAPSYGERLDSLRYAYNGGFETSVSAEPMLDTANIESLVNEVSPYVTDSIWLGKINRLRSHLKFNGDIDLEAVEALERGQTDKSIIAIYECFKDNPKVRWKDSIKKVVGIETPDKAGMDI
jgi:DNA repair photolyase